MLSPYLGKRYPTEMAGNSNSDESLAIFQIDNSEPANGDQRNAIMKISANPVMLGKRETESGQNGGVNGRVKGSARLGTGRWVNPLWGYRAGL